MKKKGPRCSSNRERIEYDELLHQLLKLLLAYRGLIRVTILKNSKILCEYDFLQRRLLNRNEALSNRELTRTFTLLDKYFKGDYNPNEASAQIKITKPESWISKIPFIGKFFTGH